MDRKHTGMDVQPPMETSEPVQLLNLSDNVSTVVQEKSPQRLICVNDVLDAINLVEYKSLFEAEKINLAMLLDLRPDEFMEMFKDIGIVPWGHRRLLRKAIEDVKQFGSLKNADDSSDETVANPVRIVDPPVVTEADSVASSCSKEQNL